VTDQADIGRLEQASRRPLAFFRQFLRHPRIVGSVIPSSRFLARRLVEIGQLQHARIVVELGPGTGAVTRTILDALPLQGRVLGIEIDENFVALLRDEADQRLIVHSGSAMHMVEALQLHALPPPDVVISGIPFSTMPPEMGSSILLQVWSALRPGGVFIAYQISAEVARLGRALIGEPSMQMELLNVPPIRIFSWTKPADEH
jgi:phosphatidylethanolamine/phosphatidyl-N-methylethanolamine N-methyltransferase